MISYGLKVNLDISFSIFRKDEKKNHGFKADLNNFEALF